MMVQRFREDQDPSLNPSFIVQALNHASDCDFEDLSFKLSKTVEEVKSDYINSWMSNRETYRQKISDAIDLLGIVAHKNNSKKKFSLVDLAEALILWRSGLVEQKYLANLYDVARNSVSNALEHKERWVEVKSKIEEIKEICFGCKNNSPCQQTPRVVLDVAGWDR